MKPISIHPTFPISSGSMSFLDGRLMEDATYRQLRSRGSSESPTEDARSREHYGGNRARTGGYQSEHGLSDGIHV